MFDVRKQWLILLLLNPLLSLPVIFFQMSYDPNWNQLPTNARYLTSGFMALSMTIWLYCMYRCCYKKRGTKLLLFILLTTVASWAYSLYSYFTGKLPAILTQVPYHELLNFFSWGFAILWGIANFRLWLANRKWQKKLDPL